MDRRQYLCGVIAAGLLGLPSAALARRPRLLTDPELDAALVVDAASGKVLYARNETATRHPASLTKLMTLYLLFEALRAKKLTLGNELAVSAHAAEQPRSHLRLRDGTTISVEMAIKAIIIRSANDAAVVVAEAVGGSEPVFVVMMNAKARQLGMTDTTYCNATGLPDSGQLTTADDLAILARHVIYDFPEYFPYFSTRSMTWHGQEYETHDALIVDYPGADGLKTGYIEASGYNLVTTVKRGDTRLIAVVMGGITPARRDEAMVRLLDDVFAQLAAAAPPGPAPKHN
ncbi:MAG: D-alanyl-D-alanine carboxypeptidase [Alphaproteobacteria bacterium]|nr:D-alanyl-D-alanine carboxypeptidase [Alphaproteobacteria bacterium]